MKLTVKQNAVIWCLQNGWELITSNDIPGALVVTKKHEYRISNRLFWNLVDKGLIYQGSWDKHRYDYVLTPFGKNIKTKKIDFENDKQ